MGSKEKTTSQETSAAHKNKERNPILVILHPGFGKYPWRPCIDDAGCSHCEEIKACFQEIKRAERRNYNKAIRDKKERELLWRLRHEKERRQIYT